jgi:hypothetical protein
MHNTKEVETVLKMKLRKLKGKSALRPRGTIRVDSLRSDGSCDSQERESTEFRWFVGSKAWRLDCVSSGQDTQGKLSVWNLEYLH